MEIDVDTCGIYAILSKANFYYAYAHINFKQHFAPKESLIHKSNPRDSYSGTLSIVYGFIVYCCPIYVKS